MLLPGFCFPKAKAALSDHLLSVQVKYQLLLIFPPVGAQLSWGEADVPTGGVNSLV